MTAYLRRMMPASSREDAFVDALLGLAALSKPLPETAGAEALLGLHSFQGLTPGLIEILAGAGSEPEPPPAVGAPSLRGNLR
jgi:hypothetical protein